MDWSSSKRPRIFREANGSGCADNGFGERWEPCRRNTPSSDPFAMANLLERLADGEYGSVTKEYESLHAQVSAFLSALRQSGLATNAGTSRLPEHRPECTDSPAADEPEPLAVVGKEAGGAIIVIDSDEEVDASRRDDGKEAGCLIEEPLAMQLWQPENQAGVYEEQGICVQYEKVVLTSAVKSSPYSDLVEPVEGTPLVSPFLVTSSKTKGKRGRRQPKAVEKLVEKESTEATEDVRRHDPLNTDKGVILPEKYGAIEGLDSVECLQSPSPVNEIRTESDNEAENDGLGDLWNEMSLAMGFSMTDVAVGSDEEQSDEEDECDHLFVRKDHLGVVCRVCGLIQTSIEKIVDYQFTKSSRVTRVSSHGYRNQKDLDGIIPAFSGSKSAEHDIMVAGIAIHPRHEKQMKFHQLEGFGFLVRNLISDNPGGCILAHAPGSGKTFMLISFIQSFLAKYESARPLVVLPKGILPTWKMEFKKWQVEEIPIYDFYSVKADSRSQQFEVLKTWEENKSILFLGYKQFANIVCRVDTSKITAACQERLLKVPSLLIIDEGHTPRNDTTDVLNALSRVQTPRKVVLSGTLFQNHVKEVFNILNLVRPKFLRKESSRDIVERIMSIVDKSGGKRIRSDNTAFYDLLEETLQSDSNLKRKVTIIRSLREMTQHVLHYYKGDFLDELPGLVDFTVMLKLTMKQKHLLQKMGKMDKFRRSALCKAIYMHPFLKEVSENMTGDRSCDFNEEKLDNIIDGLDIRDGMKTKFFMNVLSMAVSVGERLLVFSQYLLPLKFLERLVAKKNGWRSGKEMFMISGDSSAEQREVAMAQFNSSPDAKVFFGSIKACGEGISLVGASRVIILDVHLNPSVSRQAIGRAFRPGQTKKVYVYRLVAADAPEEHDHRTSFRKELTSKMWFEWSEFSNQDFEMETIDINDSDDVFFESPILVEDVKCLYRR